MAPFLVGPNSCLDSSTFFCSLYAKSCNALSRCTRFPDCYLDSLISFYVSLTLLFLLCLSCTLPLMLFYHSATLMLGLKFCTMICSMKNAFRVRGEIAFITFSLQSDRLQNARKAG